MIKKYQFLDKVNFPSDIKSLKSSELKILAKEVREEMIDAVSVTGGHLGAGLGVVELTIALHYVFDTPNDKIICILLRCSSTNFKQKSKSFKVF